MEGVHLTADCYGCQCSPEVLRQVDQLAPQCRQRVEAAGLTVVAERWHGFPGDVGGVTGVLLLAESHVAIHTWPELPGVTLDIYVCNFSADNSARAEQVLNDLLMMFQPAHHELHRLLRGRGHPEMAPE